MVMDSRFPLVFSYANITAASIIEFLIQIYFVFYSVCILIYIQIEGASLLSKDLREFITTLGIATSWTTPYHPQGNCQCGRFNSVICKHIFLALATKNLKHSHWEALLSLVLHKMRSLLSTFTNRTPHERIFSYQCRRFLIQWDSWQRGASERNK